MLLESVITCPHCAVAKAETMPATPANFSMCAAAAVQNCGPSRAIVACLLLRFRAMSPDFKSSVRARLAPPHAVPGSPAWPTNTIQVSKDCSAARAPTRWRVGSSRHHGCGFVYSSLHSSRDLDCRTDLDGHSLRPECATMWTHPLPLHRALLPRHDCAGTRACVECRLGRDLWVVDLGRFILAGSKIIWRATSAHGANSRRQRI